MFALPTLLNALTNRTAGKADCSCSISELFGPVKNSRTPSVGGFAAIGLVVSMTTFSARCSGPAARITSSAAAPFTASTMISPHSATSANVAAGMPDAFENSASFDGVRLPIRTS
jgi:hypothetical protein